VRSVPAMSEPKLSLVSDREAPDLRTVEPVSEILSETTRGEFALTVTRHASATTIWIMGVLDMAHADDVCALGELATCGTEDLMVDLSGLTFLDSTGIGSLVVIRNHAMAKGVSMHIRGASERIARLFQITGLSEAFGLTPTPAGRG
jgi:anti-sigma B factor antagonist